MMKISISLLPTLFSAALSLKSTIAVDDLQPDLSALATKFEEVTSSFLSTALDGLDEREKCARDRGEQPTCTRDKIVLRKE